MSSCVKVLMNVKALIPLGVKGEDNQHLIYPPEQASICVQQYALSLSKHHTLRESNLFAQ